MSDAISVSAPISGTDRAMSFEAGKLAQLADGAVLARIGDTVLLATAVASRSVREGADFFPLTVDIEERTYAAGKIPGSFFRREGKSSDQAILTDRLIDRPLRPSFPEGFRNEVHIVGTIVGADQVNPHDVLAINAASAALMISGIPFDGPIGATRVAYTTEGEWIPHPTFEEGEESTFELVVAGRALTESADTEIAIMMVEAGGSEKSWSYYEAGAPKVTEEVLADGLEAAKTWIRESILLQRQLVEAYTAARGPIETIPYSTFNDYEDDVWQRVQAVGTDAIAKANLVTTKAERNAALDAAGDEIKAALAGEFADRAGEVKAAIRSLTKKLVRKRIVEDGMRVDGRGTADIRPLSAEVDLFPTAHGSALFQRGETQVLNVTTLGMPRMNQLLDTITPVEFKRYMHHYNFPPYSTGETGFMRGPKRREIGHGLLAERALLPVVPSPEEFPYALRVVSDVLASNGSTSMASVCGSTLSLMAAGVPIKAPVAGIAMGLVYEGGAYVTLTDILGSEDAFGDMDFKVAGTADAVTALQLDTKIDGLPADVLAKALLQAKEARLDDPRGHGRHHLRATAARGEQRTEDRLHGDPDRQDRRGDRAQGQGHQHAAAGDRGRHRGRRRRGGRYRHHRRQGRQRGGRGAPAHLPHPRPADSGGGRGLPGQGRQHHQVRCLRERAAGPGRAAPHLEAVVAGGRQAHQQRGGRPHPRPGGRGAGRRHRSPGQGLALAGQRARGRSRVVLGQWGRRPEFATAPRPPRAGAAGTAEAQTPPPSRTRSRPSWWPTSATSAPAARTRRTTPAAATAVTAGATAARAAVRVVVDRILRAAVRHPPGHRDHGGCPLGRRRLLGRHRFA